MSNSNIEDQAIDWVKNNTKLITSKFANLNEYPSVKNPFSLFMAGSPGAGKTEFSKKFIEDYDSTTKIVRIDADEIRDMIPQYTGENAYKVQGGAGLGVTKLFDYVQKHDQNVIVDGTFSDYTISSKNIKRAIKHKRGIGIIYLYQDPIVAWEFTKKREELEGRRVSRDMFIDSFFKAKDCVNRVKEDNKDRIELYIVEKDYTNNIKKPYFNVNNIDDFIKIKYNKATLLKLLK